MSRPLINDQTRDLIDALLDQADDCREHGITGAA